MINQNMKIGVKTTLRWHVNLINLSLLLTSVLSVEENQPAIFLSPRNFNPHPYEAGYGLRDPGGVNRVGPVVFPPPPPDEEDAVNNNVITVPNQRPLNHPIDHHPYAKVASKRKNIFPGRFNRVRGNINPRVYEALSNHAARVLSEPASQLRKDYSLSSLSDQKKNYIFSYKVVDHLTGDDFSHTQSQNSRATNGEYRVKLPDGRVQIVSYIADKNGYKADVKYTENDVSTANVQIQHENQIRPIPILKGNSYDYQYDRISGSHLPTELREFGGNKVSYYAPLPRQGSKDYQNYDTFVRATPKPQLFAKSSIQLPAHPKVDVYTASNGFHRLPQPKVEIYANNNGINGLGNYVSSTVAPYLLESAKGYQEDVVGSTVATPLQEYTPLYNVY